ncbi:MAG TPA: hypothetical protein VK524_22335, partial [Polyangiaceae bacterium]|nr:hypothetical protein [Polyangiaceae bacterium]
MANESQRPAFCVREGADEVRDVFCADRQPTVRGMADLQVLVGLKRAMPDAPAQSDAAEPSELSYQLAAVAVLVHSTALSGR